MPFETFRNNLYLIFSKMFTGFHEDMIMMKWQFLAPKVLNNKLAPVLAINFNYKLKQM
jgi:hypothetical protein